MMQVKEVLEINELLELQNLGPVHTNTDKFKNATFLSGLAFHPH